MRTAALAYLVALLLGLVPAAAALAHEGQQASPGAPAPVFRHMTRFDVASAPERFDHILLVVDFPPGTWTPPHTHGGYVYTTVLDGEMSARMAGMPATERRYRAGETWVETPGEYTEVGNAGTTKARVLATALLPKGAALTTNQRGVSSPDLPPGPTTVHRTTLDATRPSGPLEVAQFTVDFDPGAWTPVHTHAGRGFGTVLAGEMTLRTGGVDTRFKLGEFWVDEPGVVYVHGNASGAFAQVGVSFVLPKGAPVLTAQAATAAPAQLPRTGGVGAPLLALGGVCLAAVACLIRRGSGRRP